MNLTDYRLGSILQDALLHLAFAQLEGQPVVEAISLRQYLSRRQKMDPSLSESVRQKLRRLRTSDDIVTSINLLLQQFYRVLNTLTACHGYSDKDRLRYALAQLDRRGIYTTTGIDEERLTSTALAQCASAGGAVVRRFEMSKFGVDGNLPADKTLMVFRYGPTRVFRLIEEQLASCGFIVRRKDHSNDNLLLLTSAVTNSIIPKMVNEVTP